jgi:lambda repressor-like predicted transcriptional regulator
MMGVADFGNCADTEQLKIGAEFIHAYLECSDAIQAEVREVLQLVCDPQTDPDDRQMLLHTIADALFPNPGDAQLGFDLDQSEQIWSGDSEEARQATEEMDREEAIFSERLAAVMRQRGLTQVQLADMSGVGQPAISNMLKRQCRPQRRTIQKFAEALGVLPEELWPAFGA